MISSKTQPSLADLTARFLARPAAEQADAAVEPHEVVAGFTTDARTTWTEATAAAKFLGVKDLPTSLPADWSAYSRQAAPADFLPMAVGHFPQQVREITSLISPKVAAKATETRSWNMTSAKSLLLTAAAARVNGDFAEAARLLSQADGQSSAVQNEQATLLWQKGDRAAAVAAWKLMPESGVTAFNLGMALLADGKKVEAQSHLKRAIQLLPETTGWHHLAGLYLALAS